MAATQALMSAQTVRAPAASTSGRRTAAAAAAARRPALARPASRRGPAPPRALNELMMLADLDIDWSDPDTQVGALGAVLGLALGIGAPAFYARWVWAVGGGVGGMGAAARVVAALTYAKKTRLQVGHACRAKSGWHAGAAGRDVHAALVREQRACSCAWLAPALSNASCNIVPTVLACFHQPALALNGNSPLPPPGPGPAPRPPAALSTRLPLGPRAAATTATRSALRSCAR